MLFRSEEGVGLFLALSTRYGVVLYLDSMMFPLLDRMFRIFQAQFDEWSYVKKKVHPHHMNARVKSTIFKAQVQKNPYKLMRLLLSQLDNMSA